MKFFWLVPLLSLFCAVAFAEEPSSGRLLIVTSPGCPYCLEFEKTVGKFYHKTAIGKRFPLTEINNTDPPAEFLDLAWDIRFIPTFLIYNKDGKEIARFRGYRDEEAFWTEMEKAIRAKTGTP
ncbi:MAG: hypothetical protein HW380_2164 [Magnetococcales bacterium]|nr:hypothetical protein [Magnetococcales bacterium]HIJ84719.1 thioredoxin family protein [Magnetococcales bacterium]